MKATSILLAVSLVANAALALAAINRPGLRAWFLSSGSTTDAPTTSASRPKNSARTFDDPLAIDPQTWARLAASDPAGAVARLRAEGFPPRLLRLLAEHLVSEQFAERRRAIAAQKPPDLWWQRPFYDSFRDPKTAALYRQLARDERDMIAQLLGPNPPIDEEDRVHQVRKYGNLAPEKVARFEQLERDYQDLMEDVRAQAGDIILPEDREKLAFLENEKRVDIAKLLTPEEFFEYELRSSVAARRLRDQLALFQPSEEEFRAMFALQNAVESKFGGGRLQNLTVAERRERNEALRQLPSQMQRVLTPERFAAYQLSTDPAYRPTREFVTEQALPPATAAQLVAVQKDTTARVNAIIGDRTLTPEQRNTQLAALATETTTKLTDTLGRKGFERYQEGPGSWLSIVQPPAPARPAPSPAIPTP